MMLPAQCERARVKREHTQVRLIVHVGQSGGDENVLLAALGQAGLSVGHETEAVHFVVGSL